MLANFVREEMLLLEKKQQVGLGEEGFSCWHVVHFFRTWASSTWDLTDSDQGNFEFKMMVFLWFNGSVNVCS